MKKDHSKDAIIQQSIEFSLMVIKYVEELEGKQKHVLANQVLISGTSIGAHIIGARSADAEKDFIYRMKEADKAAHDTWYWFYLCEHSEGHGFDKKLSTKLDEIMTLISGVILSL